MENARTVCFWGPHEAHHHLFGRHTCGLALVSGHFSSNPEQLRVHCIQLVRCYAYTHLHIALRNAQRCSSASALRVSRRERLVGLGLPDKVVVLLVLICPAPVLSRLTYSKLHTTD